MRSTKSNTVIRSLEKYSKALANEPITRSRGYFFLFIFRLTKPIFFRKRCFFWLHKIFLPLVTASFLAVHAGGSMHPQRRKGGDTTQVDRASAILVSKSGSGGVVGVAVLGGSSTKVGFFVSAGSPASPVTTSSEGRMGLFCHRRDENK